MMNDDLTTGASDELIKEFEISIKETMEESIKFKRAKLWQQFLEKKMSQWMEQLHSLRITLPRAKVNSPYIVNIPTAHGNFTLRRIEMDDTVCLNMKATLNDKTDVFTIEGTPEKAADNIKVSLMFSHNSFPDIYLPPVTISLTINPDPRQLWKDIPVPDNIEYPKVDAECDFINPKPIDQTDVENINKKIDNTNIDTSTNDNTDAILDHVKSDCPTLKTIIAASKRGRSHAHEGKPRDDHYSIALTEDGWYIAVVADGAGSATFSREGSRIACETASRVCINQLKNTNELCTTLEQYWRLTQNRETDTQTAGDGQVKTSQKETDTLRKVIGDCLYNIFGKAAFQTFTHIKEAANAKNRMAKEYATTLLMSVCKQLDFGWFVGSFWIGDGAIGIYNNTDNSVKLMCTPDEGEYSGQTRFVTMPEIFASAKSIYQRLRFCIVKDFSSLLLMTDGVSDAFFETDKNLEDPKKWEELLKNISLSLKEEDDCLPDPATRAERLLKWLDFWSPGNHDDRTIVIIQ